MNREIKFRVWDIELHMWINNIGMGKDNTLCKGTEKRFVVMQFTGLHDKNGKEIYEGDIVEFDRDKWIGNDNIHAVYWNGERASFYGVGHIDDAYRRIVIGNIYENPKLIPKQLGI